MCMHPKGGVPKAYSTLIWHTGCVPGLGVNMSEIPAGDGSFYLQNSMNGFCVHPHGGEPKEGVVLIWHQGCSDTDGRLRFVKVNAGGGYFYLKSKKSGLCVHPHKGKVWQGASWIFQAGCTGEALQ